MRLIHVGTRDFVGELGGALEHLAGVVRTVRHLHLGGHLFHLLLRVAHPHQVAVRQLLHGVASCTDLLIHLLGTHVGKLNRRWDRGVSGDPQKQKMQWGGRNGNGSAHDDVGLPSIWSDCVVWHPTSR